MKWKVPLLDLHAQYLSIKAEIDSAITRVISKGNFTMGDEVDAFEKEWAEYCQARYCIGVSSGTDALSLAIKVLGLRDLPIMTTPLTFFSTVEAIIESRNKPVFMDVGYDGNIDVTNVTGVPCSIPVHLYGNPAVIPSARSCYVIEDSCQAHGLPLRGDIACFSFFPSKNLGAYGQAGAIVTNNAGRKWVGKLRELREHGQRERFVHYNIGGNYRMDELQAAILRAKLPHLDEWNDQRRMIADSYRQSLSNLPGIILPEDHPQHVYYAFAIRTKERDKLAVFLKEAGIETLVRYPVPMHLMPALKHLGYKVGDFPMAEERTKTNLSLPIYPEMTDSQVEYVAKRVKAWMSSL